MDYLAEYKKLRDSLPRAALAHVNNQNCDFCNYIDSSKDCYLAINTLECERCFYSRRIFYCNDCIDCNYLTKCELCYQCLNCKNCFNCNYLQDCEQSTDCEYCLNCKGCQNCFGCTNLRHKQFFIFNESYSKEEYNQTLTNLKQKTTQQLAELFKEIKLKSPHSCSIAENNENSTGNHIFNNKNVQYCFETENSQDSAYCFELFNSEDCMDITVGEFSQLNYSCISAYHLNNSNFCYNCWESSDLEYCEQCQQCHDCFFCVNLLHKQYYIFNQPYSEKEYFQRKKEIIETLKTRGNYGRYINSTYPLEDSMAGKFIMC